MWHLIAFLTDYFRRIRDDLSHTWKRHLPCVDNIIRVTSFLIYSIHPDFPPMLDSAGHIQGLVVEI